MINTITKEKVNDNDNISPIQPKALKFSEHKNYKETENEKENSNNNFNNNLNNNDISLTSDILQEDILLSEKEKFKSKFSEDSDLLNQIIEKTENSDWLNLIEKEKNLIEEKSMTPIPDNTKSQISLDQSFSSVGYSVSNASNIVCKKHGQVYLGVERSKFKLICKKCQEKGFKSELELLEKLESFQDEEEITCDTHPNVKGIFYCDDCKQFLCKECFAHSHRKHNSNLPNYMSAKVKEEIEKIINEINRMKPKLEESLDEISKMNEKIKSYGENSNRIIKGTVDKISQVNKNKFDEINKDSNRIYEGLDEEVEGVFNRLSGLQKRTISYIFQINEFINKINKQNNTYQICKEKKQKSILFREIKSIIEDSKTFLNFKTPKCINEVKEKRQIFKESLDSLYKKIKIFEKSILTSIQSGMKNFSIVMRRFPKFSRKGLKYYKTSSLILKVDKSIFLAGLGLCGLYVSSRKIEDINSNVLNDMNERGKIQIEIRISEMKSNHFELENSETHSLFGMINRIDPTQFIYLKKAVFIKPEVNYLITIVNEDINPMIDIWCGEVNKSALIKMNQTMRCNCSDVTFSFSPAEGIESDFNEFAMGVMASLIYSKAD